MKYLLLTPLIFTLMLSACNSSSQQTLASEETGPVTSLLDAGNTQQLNEMLERYYALKDALAADDADVADEEALKLEAAARILNTSTSADSGNTEMLTKYLNIIKTQSVVLANVKDKSCERKRIPFEHISDAMYGALKSVQLKNRVIYRQYCPMAFNDSGAYWLSREAEIKNPYFGKKMKDCGEITETIK